MSPVDASSPAVPQGIRGRGWSLAGFALLCLIVLGLFRAQTDPGAPVSRPRTNDRAFSGLAALAEWIEGAGVPVTVLRDGYRGLDARDLPPRGNLLFVHTPEADALTVAQAARLLRWMREGNVVVLTTMLFETHGYAFGGADVLRTVELLTGRTYEPPEDAGEAPPLPGADDAVAALSDPSAWVLLAGGSRAVPLVPVSPDPLVADLDDLRVPWDGAVWFPAPLPGGIPRACGTLVDGVRTVTDPTACAALEPPLPGAWQTLLEHAGSGLPALEHATAGQGHLLVLHHPSLLGNAGIGRHGNRALAGRLVATYLAPDGHVLFDDGHQVRDAAYRARDLMSDPRMLVSVLFVLAGWAAWVLADDGTWERVTRRPRPQRRTPLDLVRASAAFLQRRVRPAVAAEGLLEPLRSRLIRRWRLPDGASLETALSREHALHPEAVDRLRAELARGRDIPLHRIHNASLALRRALD